MKLNALLCLTFSSLSTILATLFRGPRLLLLGLGMGIVGPSAAAQATGHFSYVQTVPGGFTNAPAGVALDGSGNLLLNRHNFVKRV